ncbi:hypothetical protein NC653_034710 [Populus alba x Populus x berolinensis]|uniref:Uncharacterized protein n=1 Tax=Populus alba x Populus x berolinensis TaxID=444605 RepID=A0AAD6PWG9_9ROSI|nr:hypothetical protein NC653_034698 [Populus alba x Populus x berolinensis]KAJ6970209.1 hypothetical protein NC653_034710 [Populus alba x Populus x berolinensis]
MPLCCTAPFVLSLYTVHLLHFYTTAPSNSMAKSKKKSTTLRSVQGDFKLQASRQISLTLELNFTANLRFNLTQALQLKPLHLVSKLLLFLSIPCWICLLGLVVLANG